MIITRTPLRISFVGGGTDFEDFYKNHTGRVLSSAINKYIYICVHKHFDGKSFLLKYSKIEEGADIKKIEHPLLRESMKLTDTSGVEIISMSDAPVTGAGLGSSSSFTVGLLNALYSHKGEYLPPDVLAEKACYVEIGKAKSPIGKQDQYAAAFGGLNLITFNCNGDIDVEPVCLRPEIKTDFQNHLLLFYTGQQRSANPILSEQKQNIESKFEFLKKMSNMTLVFKTALERGDFKEVGEILSQGWQMKKELASGVSNSQIDKMYSLALGAGAYGGKISGAGGGGFFLAIVPPDKHENVINALIQYRLMPFRLTESGSDIIFKD